ncbi:hypothetical protein ACFQZJ_00995 [Maribacter chungangensis]|uniref:Uncharacterized protein n=1 Tax=Maribacter chungangensis TaxID=1069117 RepID=A0ABW3AYR6_9FLAO
MNIFKKSFPLLFIPCMLSSIFTMAQDRPSSVAEEAKLIVKKIGGMEEYSSTLDLNDNRKQLLMAGQNYQTNYGIYASIEIGASSLGSNYRTLKNVEFEIVNYKPTYFIGIDSIVVAGSKMKDGLTFKIYTRALSDANTYTLNQEELKNIHFEKGSYLHSERYLNPMFPEKDNNGNVVFMKDGRIASQPDNGKAFDFEFFYKDGRHIVRKEDYDKEKQTPQMYKNEIALSLPGRRCKTSFNKVLF